jgi:hypothetical protein
VPITLRAWLRYVVPLTVLAVLAFLPVAYLASKVGAPPDVSKARAQLRIGWAIGGTAWAWQWLLVAGVAPALRGIVRGQPLSQWRAFVDGLRNLARAVVPWLIVVAAIALGELALVIPGFLLGVLLALTGASERLGEPPPAALVDSVAIARRAFAQMLGIVVAILVVNLAVTFAWQTALVPYVTKKVSAAKLLPIRTFVRTLPFVLAAISPLVACGLAATYERLKRRTT